MELFIAGACIFLMNSCSTPMKGYAGPDLPSDRTALIRGRWEIRIERCDGIEPTSRQIAVLPGVHTVEISYMEIPGSVLVGSAEN